MPQKIARINIDVDAETKRRFERWSEAEGRSNRRNLTIVARRLTEFLDEDPQKLVDLGLVSPSAMRALGR